MSRQDKLPTDWERVKLRKLVVIDKESLGTKTPPDYGFLYASLSDVNFGVINRDLPLIRFSDAPSRARRKVKKGDVLFSTVRPNLEGHARINGQVNNLIASTGFAVLSPKEIKDTDFIYQYLYSYDIKRQIYALVVGSNYPAVNSSDVANLKFSIPKSTSERQAIATLLSTWDEAIEKTERLIQVKEKRFKWLLRELISEPRKKNTEWKKVKLGDVATMASGGTPKSTVGKYYDGDILWVSISDMTSQGKFIRDTERKLTLLGIENSSAKIFPKGVVLYAMYASLGEVSIAANELATSQAILCISAGESLFNEYLYYFLLSIQQKIKTQGQVGTQSNLNTKIVKSMRVYLPHFDEQKSIAETLSTAQHEIDLLKQLTEKYKTQKRGLMQKMLTGEWRVTQEMINQYMEK